MNSFTVDIGIVGGGMVGGTLAWALGKAGYKVCLLESQTYTPDSVPDAINERSIALSYGSRLLLEHLGLWDGIRHFCNPIDHIHISEQGRFGASRLHAEEEEVESLGYVVPNSVFLKSIYSLLEFADNTEVNSGSIVKAISQQADRITIEYELAGKLRSANASLLLAADGSHSCVRRLVSLNETVKPYDQAAVIANVVCELDHNNTAYERFTDTGPLAMLPLGTKLMAMVYTVESDELENTLALDDQRMLEALQKRFGYRLGRFTDIGKRLGFPLSLLESEKQHTGRVLMMGNSARTLHPVSGQGFNLALRDIALLLESLTAGGVLTDPGDYSLLQRFCEQRKSDQRSVVRFTDSLVRIFRGKAPGFSHLRALGLMGVDFIPPLKHLLARHSMGLETHLPNLSHLSQQIRE